MAQQQYFTIGGVKIEKVAPQEPCVRLTQFFADQPITCRCKRYCADRNQTPEEARISVAKAHGIAL